MVKVVVETTKIERYEIEIETIQDTDKLFDTYQNMTIDGSLEDFKEYVASHNDKVISTEIITEGKFEDVTVIDID